MTQPLSAGVSTAWLEEPLERLLGEVPLGVAHLDEGGQVRHQNASAAQLLEGAVGQQLIEQLRTMSESARVSAEPVESAFSFGAQGEVRVLVARSECLHGYLAVIERNVMARARAESRVMRSLLAAATEAVTPEVAAQRALSTLANTLTGCALVLYDVDPQLQQLKPLAHVNLPAGHHSMLTPRPLDGTTSLVSRSLMVGQALHVSNLARSFFPFERSLPGGDRLSAVALPVTASGEVLGALYVCGPQSLLTTGEIKLVQGLADAVGTLIRHARLDTQVKRQQNALTSLLSNLPDAIFEQTAEGTITQVAGHLEGVLGIRPERVMGQRLDSLLVPEDQLRFEAMFLNVTEKALVLGEFTVERSDGVKVPCEVSAWVTASAEGRRVVRAVFRDISARKQLEAEVARARETAMKRDRLALIGQLAAGVAHEINNPLSFVKSNLTVVRDIVSDITRDMTAALTSNSPDDVRRAQMSLTALSSDLESMAQETLQGVDRITAIVQSLKATARSRPRDGKLFSPTQPLLQAVQFFIGGKHCRGLITLDVPPLPECVGEAGGLSQVILNLLDNAYDAVSGSGRIGVTASVTDKHVIIRVSDSGPGIPREVQEHLFEPFFTTKAVGKGTGLGLHISNDLLNEFGGTLTFDTGPSGTTFNVHLVRATEE